MAHVDMLVTLTHVSPLRPAPGNWAWAPDAGRAPHSWHASRPWPLSPAPASPGLRNQRRVLTMQQWQDRSATMYSTRYSDHIRGQQERPHMSGGRVWWYLVMRPGHKHAFQTVARVWAGKFASCHSNNDVWCGSVWFSYYHANSIWNSRSGNNYSILILNFFVFYHLCCLLLKNITFINNAFKIFNAQHMHIYAWIVWKYLSITDNIMTNF